MTTRHKRDREGDNDSAPAAKKAKTPAGAFVADVAEAVDAVVITEEAKWDAAEKMDRADPDGRSEFWSRFDRIRAYLESHQDVSTLDHLRTAEPEMADVVKYWRVRTRFDKLSPVRQHRLQTLRVWEKFRVRAEKQGGWDQYRFDAIRKWCNDHPKVTCLPKKGADVTGFYDSWKRWKANFKDLTPKQQSDMQSLQIWKKLAPGRSDLAEDKTRAAMHFVKSLLREADGESLADPSSIRLDPVPCDYPSPSLDTLAPMWQGVFQASVPSSTMEDSDVYVAMDGSVNIKFHSHTVREPAMQTNNLPTHWKWLVGETVPLASAMATAESTRILLGRHFRWLVPKPRFGPGNWHEIPLAVAQYVAGCVDGDGCIGVKDSRPSKGRLEVTIGVAQASKESSGPVICHVLYHLFGGGITHRTHVKGARPSWEWGLHAKARVAGLLELLQQHCALKHGQATLAIRLSAALDENKADITAVDKMVAGLSQKSGAKM